MLIYDLIIIGSGPAGLTASIYASRYNLSNIVIGKVLGGTITLAHRVENYPGFKAISGIELAQKIGEQAVALGTEIVAENVGRIEKAENGFEVISDGGQELESKALVVAGGTERRRLDVPGEKEFLGKGVSYCTNCDIPFFKEKTVALVGGSDAAVSGAIHAAGIAKQVYIIYRKDKLRAEPVWVKQALADPKIKVIYNTNVGKILGYKEIKILQDKGEEQLGNLAIEQLGNMTQDKVAAVELDAPYKNSQYLPLDGLFIEIGGVPVSSLLAPLGVDIDENGYVVVNRQMETSQKGIFAAGDFTTESRAMQQMITACAQGAVAAASAFKYLKGQQAPRILGV